MGGVRLALEGPVSPVPEQGNAGPCSHREAGRDGITTGAAERGTHRLAGTQAAIQPFHDERRVIIAQRPPCRHDLARARCEKRARETQRSFAREQRALR